MAFITPLDVNGRSYANAYVKATLANSTAQQTILRLQVWETQDLREQCVPSLPYPDDIVVCDTDMELTSNNPIDYGYKLLEASGKFPEATWNI